MELSLLTPNQLAVALEPALGQVLTLEIDPPSPADSTSTVWRATTSAGEIVTGSIELRTKWIGDALVLGTTRKACSTLNRHGHPEG